jgi:CBS domain-containing protein
VLAPLLMMGGALGGLETMVLPNEGAGFWPLISMGAILGGTMRSPFTGIVFAFELTHDMNVILPLLVASVIAHAFTSLTLKRSILTEKVARRGYHLSREYAVDPLEILFVHEVMRTNIAVLPANLSPGDVPHSKHAARRGQRLYPVVTPDRELAGVVTRRELNQLAADGSSSELADVMRKDPVVAHADEPLRVVVYRMAERGVTRMPVVDSGGKLAGIISLEDLLRARVRDLEEERRRERVLRIHLPFGGGRKLEDEDQPSGVSSGSKPDSSGVVG